MSVVATDDPDDIEVGATVCSKTIHVGEGMQGGVVIRVMFDGDDRLDSVDLVSWRWAGGQPSVVTLLRDDLDVEAATFDGYAARQCGDALFAWLGNPKRRPKDTAVRARWAAAAASLAVAGEGSNLPKAEARYQRQLAANREAS